MNRRIAACASLLNTAAVFGFALCLLLENHWGSYFSSVFIALSFMPMVCAFCVFSKAETRLAGYTAIGFSAIYAVLVLLVYYAQLTAVQTGGLSEQAANLLDFQRFGLFFSYDLLGYALMALASFFAGLTVEGRSKADRTLKILLLVHGVFFIACFTMPLLGIFTRELEGADWIGTSILIFWCLYFIPVGMLSYRYFSRHQEENTR